MLFEFLLIIVIIYIYNIFNKEIILSYFNNNSIDPYFPIVINYIL